MSPSELPPAPRILVVEDEGQMRSLVRANLAREGFLVETAGDGRPVLERHRQMPFDLIVLDLMLPGVDGFQVVRSLRSAGERVPVLLLTARDEEETRARGLELGADDFLPKPFSVLELLSRIRAILGRSHPELDAPTPTVLISGPVALDRELRELSLDGSRVELEAPALRILECLLLRPGHVHSREELVSLTWAPGSRPASERIVDLHVQAVRAGLGRGSHLLVRIDGIGYRWAQPVQVHPRP
jgi:DNA-binding response OmpR family regulator